MFIKTTATFVASALLMLAAPQASATPAEDNLLSVRLMMACPDAKYVKVKEGKITAYSPLSESKKVGECLHRAYMHVAANPNVLSGADCPNGRATLRDGKIILSC